MTKETKVSVQTETPTPVVDEYRLMVLKMAPRNADVNDVEDLCCEVERLQDVERERDHAVEAQQLLRIDLYQARRERDDLVQACKALMQMMDTGPKPRKLDEALTWRENDDAARDMAERAIAAAESTKPNPEEAT